MNKLIHRLSRAAIAMTVSVLSSVSAHAAEPATIVLVHGAFAESASWDGVVQRLQARHYTVVAAANPLRGVASDARAVGAIVDSIHGPVVLVGHSYGGSVISEAGQGKSNVKALVYVAAFAPEAGETALGLTGKFPGSTLGGALGDAVPLPDGGKDLYIRQDKFPAQFAADVAPPKARLMAAAQRPIAEAALTEASTEPAWKDVPSYFVYGTADRNIPPAALSFMAERAHSARTVVIEGGSHVVMVSHPDTVADLIVEAAKR